MDAARCWTLPVFGENTGRMSATLQKQYGLTPKQTAFFDFFATPVPGFEEAALAVIADGLETDGDPRQLYRAASPGLRASVLGLGGGELAAGQ